MTLIYILGFLIIVGVIAIIGKEINRRNTPYYSTRTRIGKDIKYYTILGDWRKVQELNLQNLWLDSVNEINTYNFLEPNKKHNEDVVILSKLTIEDLKYPLNWSTDNYEHIIFAYKIIHFYSELVANNTDERPYKPNNSLPIPKSSIKKAVDYFIELTEGGKNKFDDEKKKIIMDFVYFQRPFLDMFYLDTGDEDLPQDKRENYKAAMKYSKK